MSGNELCLCDVPASRGYPWKRPPEGQSRPHPCCPRPNVARTC